MKQAWKYILPLAVIQALVTIFFGMGMAAAGISQWPLRILSAPVFYVAPKVAGLIPTAFANGIVWAAAIYWICCFGYQLVNRQPPDPPPTD